MAAILRRSVALQPPIPARDASGRAPGAILSEPCASCPVRGVAACVTLAPATRAALSRRLTQSSLAPGVPLATGEPGAVVGVLASGWLRRVRFAPDGRRRVLGLVQPGELISASPEAMGEVEAATEAWVCRFDRAELDRLAPGDRSLSRARFAQAHRELDRLRHLALCLAVLTPEQRLAGFLAASVETMAWRPAPTGGGVLTLQLPRPDIADMLGTTVESISRVTRRFAREGLIRILDPSRFEIPDLDALARLASVERLPPASSALRGAAPRP